MKSDVLIIGGGPSAAGGAMHLLVRDSQAIIVEPAPLFSEGAR